MKKLYLLLIALVASVAANADYYINGDFINWKGWTQADLADYKFTTNAQGLLELDLTTTAVSDLNGAFLCVEIGANGPDWNTKIGASSGKVKEGVNYFYSKGGNVANFQVDGTIANAKIVINPYAGFILVTGQAQSNQFDVVYMIGDFGSGWDQQTKQYPLAAKPGVADTYEGTYTISTTAPMQDYFFTKPACGTQILGPIGEDVQPVMGEKYDINTSSDKSFALEPGTYTFTVTADQTADFGTIVITSSDRPSEITFYFDNTESMWDEVTAYFSDAEGNEDEYLMEATGQANIFEGYATSNYTKVYFSDGSDKTAEYDLKDSYIYSVSNSGTPYTAPRDYSSIYVNVLGEFNGWADNGINPNEEGIATLKNLAIGIQEFKVKVWDGKENWFSTGDVVAQSTWVKIKGNSNVNMTVAGATADQMFDVSFNVNTNEIYIEPAQGEIDYTKMYVNVVGDFNSWEYNGQNPDVDGVVLLPATNVNTSFKIKVYDPATSADTYYAVDGELPVDQWKKILGNQDNMTLPAELQDCDVIFTFNCKTAEIKVVKDDAGVEGITIDSADAPVYYNLQGVKVTEPANGLYIVKRGNKVTKEIVR